MILGLSKEMISMDEIAVIVITSGHPSHTGNLNLFPLKPTLFHTMEFVEQHATVSELKDVCLFISFFSSHLSKFFQFKTKISRKIFV